MTINNTPLTDLDFFSVKNNLKDYLRQQARFKDFDFDGSNISVLLDVLAYNAYQNNFYTNMAVSEMFLDSAQLRQSVISHAKELNYLPASRTSASAELGIRVSGVSGSPNFVVLPARTRFLSQCGSKKFSFSTDKAATVYRDAAGAYGIDDLLVHEGTYRTELFQVDGNGPRQRFILSADDIDVNSIRVMVRANLNEDSTVEEYLRRDNIFGVAADDAVFYLQAHADARYQVTFGQDAFGKQPVNGAVIVAEYRTTLGEDANGASKFSAASTVTAPGGTYTIEVLTDSRATGGSERESTDSIKFFAPKSIQIQDRAVTETDYEILLKNRFPEIQSVAVFGGEEVSPPQYGRVIVAVDTNNAEGLSENDRAAFSEFLDERSPIAIVPVVQAPEFMHLEVVTTVAYDTDRTSLAPADIRATVFDAIRTYDRDNLSDFKRTFRYSSLVTSIDQSSQFIISNDTRVRPVISFEPVTGSDYQASFSFANPLARASTDGRPTITSSSFTHRGENAVLRDDGKGAMRIVKIRENDVVDLARNIGTVDYATGKVSISKFNVSAFEGDGVRVYGRPANADIKSPRTRIMTIRDSDVTINIVEGGK